jgi:DNA-binding NtrC family response regulator
VLDQREFLPVGASSPQRLDARIIAATNRDLEQEIEERRFRGDLYWRLNDVQIHLPPLRDRPSDIPLLASHFAAETPIAENAISELKRYPRPGNVRQLANVVKVACVLAGDEPVRPEHLDGQIRAAGSPQPGSASKGVHREPAAPVTRQRYQRVGTEDAEKRMMADALEQARGNVTLAASLCGMARSTFNAKMREHRLTRSQFLNLKGSP